MTGNQAAELDDLRVRVIQEAITYSRRFKRSWFIVHAGLSSIEPASVSQDLLLLRSLGINIAIVIPEPEPAGPGGGPGGGIGGPGGGPGGGGIGGHGLAVDLRKALNRDELTAVGLSWEETRAFDVAWRHPRRWQQVGESSSLIVVVHCQAHASLHAALTLAVECAAAKLVLLEEDWDPARLPIGGPGTPAPSADLVRPHLAALGSAAAVIGVEAVEAGISEVHIVPTRGKAHPILLEIFTDAGIGTWIGA